jgi:uncharacterized membrane protein YfhO
LLQDYTARAQERLTLTRFSENHIYGTITVPQPRILFFSIPFDRGWQAVVNGANSTLYRVNLGFTGILLPAGNNSIELHFTPRLMKLGALISISAILVITVLFLQTWRRNRAGAT